MTGTLDALLTSLGPLAVLLVMAVVFIETGLMAGFILPGDSLLFTAGLLVAHGTIGVPIWAVVPLVCAAAVIGDQVGYAVGRRYGPRVLTRPRSRLLNPAHLDRASSFFDRHGPRAVVLARFVPVARTFTPVAAGAGKMPYRTYLAYNIAGGALWCTTMLLAGYLLGGIPLLRDHIEVITIGIVALSLLPAIVSLLRAHQVRVGPWLAAAACAIATLGVVLLSDAVLEADSVTSYDPTITSGVVSHRTSFLSHAANAASFAGSEGSVAVLTTGVLVVLAGRRWYREAVVLAAGMAGAGALVVGVKRIVDRARPGAAFRLGAAEATPSFPSGHTLMTAAFLSLGVWLLWPHLNGRGVRFATVAGAAVAAFLVGGSRVYLGYHWATDVLAAWLVAAAWVGALLLVTRRWARPGSAGRVAVHGPGSSGQHRSRGGRRLTRTRSAAGGRARGPAAVIPPTTTCTDVPSSASGITSERSRSSRSPVTSSAGWSSGSAR
ncbi:phosphatase PAP2 family protein [Nocardioides sp. MAH-18]|uniref:Phosphatase PAP2 family protein n=1 Tax=Nocardioides agri TaxID=2682843 RepID=A0A6L6XP69_9ACTN|nr:MULTISPECIES: VTT domain-containing protein [unclassified Nocardioides]MBA2953757.1 VTT domain-containing protein [Nocardioides sp. CGMCC 1.13656]MVQ48622.1 phosphatase PAP2 family protein [Nocardioides sp. MAH-18]